MIVALESLKRNAQNLSFRRKGMQAIKAKRMYNSTGTEKLLDESTYPKEYSAAGKPITLRKYDLAVLVILALVIIVMVIYLS